jgi:hypothetical protein
METKSQKNYMGMNIYHLLDLFLKKNLGKKFKIGNKGNRKANFIFWKFKDQRKWKKRGKKI